MSHIKQQQIQKLLQKLSPQQIQMIKLLELPTIQLEQRIKREIEENPVLEEEVSDEQDEIPKQVSVDEFLNDETPNYKYYSNNYSKGDEKQPVFLSNGMTLQEYLIEQLGFKNLKEEDYSVAKYVIGSLDDDGYLRRDLTAISDDLAFSLGVQVSEEKLEEILHIIQSLEPAGIGARDLQECLLLQLKAKPELNPDQKLALRVLERYFDEFTKKHYEKILSRLGVTEDMFRDIIEEILHLAPKPANQYNEGKNDIQPYINPDFTLDYQNGVFELSLNSSNIPDLRINRQYLEMIRDLFHQGEKNLNESNKETIQFVKNKIDSAKWFISAIKQRHDTLMHTMQAILDYQREYFIDGDQSKLRPMILKDIAEMTSLDVSTISRVVNSKYVQTPFGILSLKQLFSEAMQTKSGEEVSSYEIKKILTEHIEKENKQKPLTDDALREILNDKGYEIARRTVAKYREMLGIPIARLRKEL